MTAMTQRYEPSSKLSIKNGVIAVIALLVLSWAWQGAEMAPMMFFEHPENMVQLGKDFFPADFSESNVYLTEMLVTIQVGIWGTVLSILLAIPFGILSAENLMPSWVTFPIRRLMDCLRAINEMVFAMLFVVVVGLGPFAGVMALFIAGFLAWSRSGFGETAVIPTLWSSIFVVVSFAGLAVVVFWAQVRAFSKKTDVLTYLVLFLFYAAALKGSGIVREVFAAQLARPELSHVVIEADDPALLIDQTLPQLDALLAKDFTPTDPAPTIGRSSLRKGKEPAFVYGRLQADVDIGRAHWKADDREGDLKYEQICRKSERVVMNSIEILAVDMSEPFVSRIKHLTGPSLKELTKTGYHPKRLRQGSGIFEVYVTKPFAKKLFRRLGVPESAPLHEHTHFCLRLFDTYSPVKIAGIVDHMPNDRRGSNFQLLTTTIHLKAAMRESDIKRRGYQTAAIYLDPGNVGDFVDRIRTYEDSGVPVRVGRSSRARRATLAFETGDGFNNIVEALKLGKLFGRVTWYAVWMIVFLAAVVTGIRSRNYILQNERSLCVMRAFGIRTVGILRMMLMQFAVLLLPVFFLIAALGYLVWPVVVADVAPLLEVTPGALALTWTEGLFFAGSFLLIVFGGCLAAIFFWWRSSRWIADRLKEIS